MASPAQEAFSVIAVEFVHRHGQLAETGATPVKEVELLVGLVNAGKSRPGQP